MQVRCGGANEQEAAHEIRTGSAALQEVDTADVAPRALDGHTHGPSLPQEVTDAL